ncbi:MAG: tRNA (adenosine(37)-N6)-threonylcarbamoyltransferase complex ATPase subunit type 1 TsaE [Methylococcales bacterium]|nr:tRNA (adenosine(37)-N6)-threonylcarbamoyltransferase complex ATPase subunit type 1 TsaE [Methylococcales bacterium]
MKIELNTLEDTTLMGKKLWPLFPKRCLIFLQGDLGAGKTTLVRSLLNAAGHQSKVKSPTYTLVEEYNINHQIVFHFDFYRINDPEELEFMGIRDYLDTDAICFIEWAELGQPLLPAADFILNLKAHAEKRILTITNNTDKSLCLNWKNKDLLL